MSSSRTRTTLAAVVAIVLVAVAAASATPAAAQAPGSISITGHGFGHGRGLGQHGAYGYAKDFGWQHTQILDHFYGGTTMGSVPAGTTLRIRLARNRTGLAQDLGEITITSGVPFNVGGMAVDPGRGVTIRRVGGGWHAYVSVRCGTAPVYDQPIANGFVYPSVFDPGNDPNRMLTICNADGAGENRTYRGTIEQVFADGALRTVNTVTSEQYLRSVVPREMPASWHVQALASQAVAARSYGLAERRYSYADTCSTDQCQVYYGYASNKGSLMVWEDSRTDAAIAGTANLVRRTSGGAIARTEFSSSSGGYTAGGAFPAVPDDGDDVQGSPGNPYHDWGPVSVTHAAIASRYAVGTLLDVAVTARNGLGADGGRVLAVAIRGTAGTATRTGDQFRSDWGLRSDWFSIEDGLDYLDWYLRHDNAAGPAANTITYGSPTNRPILGDWDGNGTDTIGVYERGNWYLRNVDSAGSPNLAFAYGSAGDIPVVGDWDGGTGVDGVGVYSGGTFYLRSSPSAGPPTIAAIPYGGPGATPVVGDWDGNGTVTIGVYVGGNWYLRNSNTPGPPDISLAYGGPADRPVVGDWDGGAGPDTIGVFSQGNWYLRSSNTPGPPTFAFAFGAAGYLPVVGDHDASGGDTVGVAVP